MGGNPRAAPAAPASPYNEPTSPRVILPSSHVRTIILPALLTTMIVFLAILVAIRAFPVSLRGAPVFSLDQLQTPICDINGCRSLGDIIKSCVVTVLLCTWFSAHPNIPSPDEKWPRIASRRVKIMLVTLVAPEAIIIWAWKQRQLAIRLAEKHKGESQT